MNNVKQDLILISILLLCFLKIIPQGTARLVEQRSKDPASISWLVSFVGGASNGTEEELSEETFGAIIGKEPPPTDTTTDPVTAGAPSTTAKTSDTESKSSSTKGKNNASKKKVKGSAGATAPTPASTSNSSVEEAEKKSAEEMPVGKENDPSDSDTSSPKTALADGAKAKVSDREQRSRRRQEIIEQDPPPAAKRIKEAPRNTNSKKKVGDEEVIKVPMLTGTLYLYRGIRRRVEFIRKS